MKACDIPACPDAGVVKFDIEEGGPYNRAWRTYRLCRAHSEVFVAPALRTGCAFVLTVPGVGEDEE